MWRFNDCKFGPNAESRDDKRHRGSAAEVDQNKPHGARLHMQSTPRRTFSYLVVPHAGHCTGSRFGTQPIAIRVWFEWNLQPPQVMQLKRELYQRLGVITY